VMAPVPSEFFLRVFGSAMAHPAGDLVLHDDPCPVGLLYEPMVLK
jgi:hypothetical protein